MSSNNLLKSIKGFQTIRRLSSSSSAKQAYEFSTLKVTNPHEFVYQVQLNRPEKRNAMNPTFFTELKNCFDRLKHDQECRAIVLSASGKGFTSGIDLTELGQMANMDQEDAGRKAFAFQKIIDEYQNSISSVENCHKPVIALVHGHCVGGGVDLITACDIRYCSKDAWFSVKEVDVGLAADIGTLQRLPRVVGNDSLARELVYTARRIDSQEAKELGLISKILDDQASLLNAGLELAKLIASKSPIAVQGSKINLVYSRDHSVKDGLKFISAWNGSMLQSEDLLKAAMASFSKETAKFSKL